jgi:poly(3-hydroxybutyrate) depolymerase
MSIAYSLCRRYWLNMPVLALLTGMLAWPQTAPAAEPAIAIPPGPGSFTFVDEQGDASKNMTVYTYLPQGVDAKDSKIVFVMHGHGKNAKGYRDAWIKPADAYRFLVIAPNFDAKQWRGGDYAYPRVLAQDGKSADMSRLSYSVIEHLFDAVKAATGNRNEKYWLYGHSEGGQFVHRLALMLPDARYARVVVANPGWYTMPRFDVKYPYGLGATPATETSLKTILGRDVVVLLGDRDTDPNHAQLNKSAAAELQGANRFERGHNFMREAQNRAAELKCPFGWRLEIARGVAHSNNMMAGPAAAALMEH